MLRMRFAETRRNQHLERSADQFIAPVAEQTLRLRIHQDDNTARISDDEGVRRRIQDAAESYFARAQRLLRILACCNVPNRTRYQYALRGLYWAQTDLDRECAAVPTLPQQVK